jgi:Tfp pilus assembly protein PilN
MAELSTGRVARCNLLRTRSAAPSLYARRPAIVRSAALLVVLLCALAGWIFSERNNRHQQLQTLLKKSEQLQSRLSDHQAVPEQRTRLDAWLASAPNPSTSLRGLLALVPADNRVLLTRVQLENIADTNESVLTMDGLAQSPTEISELNTAVLLQPHRYLLRPYGIEPAPPESSLKVKFRTECLLLPPSANTPEPQP